MMKPIQKLKAFITKGFPVLVLFLLMHTGASAQKKTVTGKVVSDSGTAVTGASIRIKGSTIGTTTNADGSFTISAAQGEVIEITGVGFGKQEYTIGSSNEITINLNRENRTLNEVVVIGYGTSTRKDLTGAISSVNAKTIESVPVPTVESALQGRMSGVQVTSNDGAPGGNITVLIRGTGSLGSYGNTPLYVVDGYPLPGGINNINPSDIATMDVLKDASATSIYGVRAANGVVIITTKKGRRGATQVYFDGYLSVQSQPKKYDVLDAKQFATLSNEVQAADSSHNYTGFAPWHNPDSLTNVNWQDAIYRTGLTQNYSLALRGGSDKLLSSVSVGYYDQKGIVQGSYFQRLTLGVNLDYTPLKWLKSITSAKYAYQNANNPFGTGNLLALAQNPPTMDGGNKLTNDIKDAAGNYGFYNPINTYVSKYNNPLYAIQTNQAKNVTNYFLGNSALEVLLFDGLTIKTLGGITTSAYNGSFFQPEDDRKVNQYGSAAGASSNAFYSQHIYNSFDWLWENTLAYDKNFGPHAIHFVGGVSAQKTTNNFMGGSGIPPNSIIRDLAQVSNLKMDAYNSTGGPGNGQTELALSSQFARLTYGFQDKYLVTGTVRRDGSSRFAPNNRYATFGSGAVAWRAKQESFLENVDWLSELKFRGSYGSIGNQSTIPLYQYQALYSTGLDAASSGNLGYPFNKIYQRGYAQIQPENPDLKWETDIQTDIGMDIAFLHGDLTMTVDWFNRESRDFLLTLAAPAQTGYNFITRNVGSMTNKGWEFAVNYGHTINKDFHYSLGLTLTTIDNKLTSITSGTTNVTNFGGLTLTGSGWGTFSKTYIGQPVGEFYGYQSIGIFQSQKQIDALNAASAAANPLFPNYQKAATQAGDRYFADTNGDGHVDETDQVSLGSPIPTWYGGLNVDLTYKAFDFNLFFYGVYGNKILNYAKNSMQTFQNRGFAGVENVSKEYYDNHWTPLNPSDSYSRVSANDDQTGNAVPSSAWVENGSYLKLKNLTIGYTFPASITNKASISRLRVYISTQNLFTITSYSGLDPEIGLQNANATQNGVDNGVYPSSRFFTFGLNVTL
jgi:TonB-linked SusC/RagA family outer membrane protein